MTGRPGRFCAPVGGARFSTAKRDTFAARIGAADILALVAQAEHHDAVKAAGLGPDLDLVPDFAQRRGEVGQGCPLFSIGGPLPFPVRGPSVPLPGVTPPPHT